MERYLHEQAFSQAVESGTCLIINANIESLQIVVTDGETNKNVVTGVSGINTTASPFLQPQYWANLTFLIIPLLLRRRRGENLFSKSQSRNGEKFFMLNRIFLY